MNERTNKERFNEIGRWVSTELLTQMKLKDRTRIMQRFIEIAVKCRDINDLNSMRAIVSGLEGNSIHRLKFTWDVRCVSFALLYSSLVPLRKSFSSSVSSSFLLLTFPPSSSLLILLLPPYSFSFSLFLSLSLSFSLIILSVHFKEASKRSRCSSPPRLTRQQFSRVSRLRQRFKTTCIALYGFNHSRFTLC